MRETRSQIMKHYQTNVRHKHKKVYIWIGIGLLCSCFAIFNMQLQNIWIQFVYKPQQAEVMNVAQIRANQMNLPKTMHKAQKVKTAKSVDEHIHFSDITNAKQYRKEMKKYIIGAIYLPNAAGVSLPVIVGNTNEKVQKAGLAVGAVTPMSNMNFDSKNLVLGSHNMLQRGVEFSNLTDLQKGDKVYTTDTKNVFTYKVYKKLEIKPSQVSILKQHKHDGKQILTLYTCNTDGSLREIVQAEKVKTTKYSKAPKHVTKHFNFSRKRKENLI